MLLTASPPRDNISVNRTRNFSIIAHIDHGKSTLADRFLEITGTLRPEEMTEQTLDFMDLERERGITIKMKPVRMEYRGYILNLIDTPGHVDFTYEVSRSLAAVEGALLLVDATQGVEAQTISNLYLALDADLEVIPVVNKIDLPSADPERVAGQIKEIMGDVDVQFISAKEGHGVRELLDLIIQRVPPPKGNPIAPLRALIFDAVYDDYRGVIPYIRVFDGEIRPGMRIAFASTGREYEVTELGFFKPYMQKTDVLSAGDVGYLVSAVRDISEARVGDTIIDARYPDTEPLPGYREAKPMVYAGIYPVVPGDFPELTKALEKLKLQDAALSFIGEHSPAIGPGYRCGFLGMLHMEITTERLRREFGLEIVLATPTVHYRVKTKRGEIIHVEKPSDFPDDPAVAEEPYVRLQIVTPTEYIGPVMELAQSRRGEQKGFSFLDPGLATLEYEIPLSEVIYDFFDKLKSASRGYASMDYDLVGWRASDLVRLDILVAGERIDAFSAVVHRDRAYRMGKAICEKLRSQIPRHLFEVVIQAAIGGRIIARERIAPLRKDVTAKCYGGDITRKRKLLERQKEGKRRMKRIGKVDVPPEAFLEVMKAREG
ncbi:MAG: translation elongation factor 4 [candidate division WOR-3 bacterium]